MFGSPYYLYVPSEKRSKLEDKVEKGIFLGYSTQTKGYKVYNLKTDNISITRNVQLNEDRVWNWE